MLGSPRRAAFAGVFAGTLVTFLAVGAVLPILPRYVKGPLGGGDVEVGIVTGAFAFAAILGRPIGGRIADRRTRKLVAICGMAMCAAAGALYFLPLGVAGLVFARLVLGLGDGWVYTATAAWVVDLAPPERRGQVIGLFGMSIWGGLSVGPVCGEILLRVGGSEAVWVFAILTPLVAAALVSRLPETREPAGGLAGPAATAVAPAPAGEAGLPTGRPVRGLRAWLPRGVAGPGAALTLGALGFATFASFIVLHMDERGINGGPAAFVAFASSVVVGRLVLGHVPDRHGPRVGVITAGICQAIGLTAVAFAGSLAVAFAGAIVMGAGFSLLLPSLALVALGASPPEQRGVVLGAFTAFFDLGIGLGGPVSGAISSVSGYEAAFLAAAGAAAGCAALGAFVARGPAGLAPRRGDPPLPDPV